MHVPATPEIVEWTPYGYKHSPSKNLAWEDIVSSTRYGPAKYKPGINIEKLEREAYKNGVPSTHAKPWKLREYPQVIGASDGKPSYWVRIESSAGVIHGFIDGNVTHDDLSILQDGAMESQVHLLKEDMLQVEYAGGLILDVGWYPSFDTHGGFRINVIRNYDWDRPVIALTAHAAARSMANCATY
eukprot:gene138-163_t